MNKERIRRRLLRIIRKTAQLVRDIEFWNNNRTDERPIDCESEKVLIHNARRSLVALEKGDGQEMLHLSSEMVTAATEACEQT